MIKRTSITLVTAVGASLALLLGGCTDTELQRKELEYAVPEAWDAAQKAIDERAIVTLESLARQSKYGDNFESDWNTTFGVFTIVNPIDYSSRAAISLLMGGWGDSFNALESYGREMIDEDGARRTINKRFDETWADTFVCLLAIDGTFTYEVETDGWGSNSFEFDSSDIYGFLQEHGYMN